MSLTRALRENWTEPRAIAIQTSEGPIDYAGLIERIERAVGWLQERGVGAGEVVALQMGKVPAFVELHLAALAIGAITLPLNDRYTETEVRWMLEDAGARLAVCPGPAPCDRVDPASVRAELDLAPRRALPDGVDLECIGVLCYTSGTTGRPKGAQIRQRNLRATVEALHQAWAWRRDDVLLHALPLFHVHGLFVAQHGALRAGATTVWLDRFDPEAVFEGIRTHRATVFMGVPTFYHRLLHRRPEHRDLSSVRLFTSGSAGLPSHDWHAWQRATGHRIVERYGMTEVGIVISNPLDDPRPGSIGVPLPGVRARVVRVADRRPCAPDEVGELEISGESVFAGYLERPQATASALVDGWMRTGDLATADPSGRIRLVGRQSELIIRGGLNIYPAEVEAVLNGLAGIEESAVFGMPDPDLGEQVHAAVVSPEPIDPEALRTAALEQLAPFKVPTAWHRVSELPRNAMGKVLRSALRARAQTE